MDLFDAFTTGDVLGMIGIWGDVLVQAGSAFTDAFALSPSEITPAVAAETSTLTAPVDYASMTGPFAVLALVWLVFMLFTHTPAWARITEWKMPVWVSVVIAIPLILFAGISFWSFAFTLPLEAYASGVAMFLLICAALPIFPGICLLGEKFVAAFHR